MTIDHFPNPGKILKQQLVFSKYVISCYEQWKRICFLFKSQSVKYTKPLSSFPFYWSLIEVFGCVLKYFNLEALCLSNSIVLITYFNLTVSISKAMVSKQTYFIQVYMCAAVDHSIRFISSKLQRHQINTGYLPY